MTPEENRLAAAIEELRAAAKALGLDPSELEGSIEQRADAWMHRADALLGGSRRIAPTPDPRPQALGARPRSRPAA